MDEEEIRPEEPNFQEWEMLSEDNLPSNQVHCEMSKCPDEKGEMDAVKLQDGEHLDTTLSMVAGFLDQRHPEAGILGKKHDLDNALSAQRTFDGQIRHKEGASDSNLADDNTAGRKSPTSKKRRVLTADERQERNKKEQERSNRLSNQFAELRDHLMSSGVIVPKGTKGAVLEITLQYIRALQQRHREAEM